MKTAGKDQETLNSIVLCGDNSYSDKMLVTIKSIMAHNRNVAIYVINTDIPQEWFISIRKRLQLLHSDIIDVKIEKPDWEHFKTAFHINQTTFYRYLIPQYVPADKALYLDSDLIVTNDISHLFKLDIDDYYIAAVENRTFKKGSNAGVMLINLKKWRAENITEELIQLTYKKHDEVATADQSIMNMRFGANWYRLNPTYNFQIGADKNLIFYKHYDQIAPLHKLPVVLHYLMDYKPWNHYNKGRLRDIWWQYYDMDWSQIIAYNSDHLNQERRLDVLIVTATDQLAHIEELLSALPYVNFHIFTWVVMSDKMLNLQRYENCKLYPASMQIIMEELFDSCDIFLGINLPNEVDQTLSQIKAMGKPIFAFSSTAKDKLGYSQIFDSVEEMARTIDSFKTIDYYIYDPH